MYRLTTDVRLLRDQIGKSIFIPSLALLVRGNKSGGQHVIPHRRQGCEEPNLEAQLYYLAVVSGVREFIWRARCVVLLLGCGRYAARQLPIESHWPKPFLMCDADADTDDDGSAGADIDDAADVLGGGSCQFASVHFIRAIKKVALKIAFMGYLQMCFTVVF